MKYRLLTPGEWPRLENLIPPELIPSPETSVIAIAEDDDGRILGVLPLQLQWHMEPLFLFSPDISFSRLKEVLDNQLRDFPGSCYYTFVPNQQLAEIVGSAGMEFQPALVFRWPPSGGEVN